MEKKLLINANILSDKNTGLGEYTFNMLNYVSPYLIESGIKFDILCGNADFLPQICKTHAVVMKRTNFIKRNLQIDKILKNKHYDLVWSTTQHGVLVKKCRQIITVHDLTPLKFPKGRFHQYIYYRFFLPKVLKKAEIIFTVSQNTKCDLFRYYKNKIKNEEKIKVLYESIDENKIVNFCEVNDILDKFQLDKKKYFCITGIHYHYKNIHSVIKVFAQDTKLSTYKVAIIGNDNCKYAKYLKKLLVKNDLSDRFIFTGYIDSDSKNTLLKHCLASIYPSLYEGFGLPLLESMLLGVPVISSSASSLTEIGGDAVLYFNPNNILELKEKLLEIIENPKLCSELIIKGKINLKRYDWNEIAFNTFKILNEHLVR